jgi:glucose dehydrogenase
VDFAREGGPCSAPPWAALTAVDLVERKIVWEVPLESSEKMLPVRPPWDMNFDLGTPGAGVPVTSEVDGEQYVVIPPAATACTPRRWAPQWWRSS